MTDESLSRLFNPRSVALIGATATPGKLGERIVSNLIENGFSGRVYPVHRTSTDIRGIRCYPNIEAIPEPIDVGYVLVPAQAAVDVVWELGRCGAAVAIVAAAGFDEANTDEGRRLQASLADACAKTGIRIVGPNCNGIYSATNHTSIGFNTAHGWKLPVGGLGIVSHSGALFSSLMLCAQEVGVGLSTFVSAGNECDLTLLDYMQYLIDDDVTRCIALILDSLPDGERFQELTAAAWARGKRTIALKIGTSATGAAAAVAHSSRLAGRADTYAALFAHCGVGVVNTIEDLISAAAVIERSPVRARPRLGVVAMSGGAGAIIADAATRHGLELPPLSHASQRRIDELAPGSPTVNPVDLGAGYGQLTFPDVLDLISSDTRIDVVLYIYHPMSSDEERLNIATQLVMSHDRSRKPHVVLAPGRVNATEDDLYRKAGIVVMTNTDTCMAALSAAGAAPPVGASQISTMSINVPVGGGAIDDVRSIALARELGVPMVATIAADTVEEAAAAADICGWPVVLKGLADGIAHKSDNGYVVVGIATPGELRSQAKRLTALGARRFLVQPHVTGDFEALLGIVTEPRIGRFVVFGLGGVYAEALADIALVPIEASVDEITEALAGTRLGAVLKSPRWPSPRTFDRMVEVIRATAAATRSADTRLIALDINPLLIRNDEIIGVDALAVIDEGALSPRRTVPASRPR